MGFGLVLGEDGKRFRTRATEVVKLVDLLDEAKNRCKATLIERGKDVIDELFFLICDLSGYFWHISCSSFVNASFLLHFHPVSI